MNKEEKAIAESMGTRLCESIDLLTAALKYHADTLGYYVDSINPTDDKGHQKVKLSLTTDAKQEVTFDELRAAVNKFAADEGKEKTLELVKVYAPSGALKDVKESDYSELLASVL